MQKKWYTTNTVRTEPLSFELASDEEQPLQQDFLALTNEHPLVAQRRSKPKDFSHLNEAILMRHYHRLEKLNYAWENGLYPLGSCTMKYNPILHEALASSEVFAHLHPALPPQLTQGALQITYEVQEGIRKLLDLAAVTLQPAAGAHGELTAVFMVRAYFAAKNENRDTILIPESAHGTNPASAAMGGYKIEKIKSAANGLTDIQQLREKCNPQVAAFMITNPNTIGTFEKDIVEIKKILDEHGILLFVDGANLNAILGRVSFEKMGADLTQLNLHKTFSTPHGGGGPGQGALGVSQRMVEFLPTPHVEKIQKDGSDFYQYYQPKQSIGPIKSWYSQFGNVVRVWVYFKTWGSQIDLISERAVLNANYIRHHLQEYLALASQENSMHEVTFSQKTLRELGLTTMNLAKFLLDRGFYAPTVYFPLHVDGAIMIEPTETESKEELDLFIAAVKEFFDLAKAGKTEFLKNTPHQSVVRQVDDVQAARKPILTWDMLLQNDNN